MRGIEARLRAIEDRMPKPDCQICLIVREIETHEQADTPETPEQAAALAQHLAAHPWKTGQTLRSIEIRKGNRVTENGIDGGHDAPRSLTPTAPPAHLQPIVSPCSDSLAAPKRQNTTAPQSQKGTP